jgi:hypothetical protein
LSKNNILSKIKQIKGNETINDRKSENTSINYEKLLFKNETMWLWSGKETIW